MNTYKSRTQAGTNKVLLMQSCLYLYKIAQLRWKDENIRGDGHLTKALELLIIHVNVLHRWVQRVETVRLKQKHECQ